MVFEVLRCSKTFETDGAPNVKLFKMGELLMIVEEGWCGKFFGTDGALCRRSKTFFRFSDNRLLVNIDKVAGECRLVMKSFFAEVTSLFENNFWGGDQG